MNVIVISIFSSQLYKLSRMLTYRKFVVHGLSDIGIYVIYIISRYISFIKCHVILYNKLHSIDGN